MFCIWFESSVHLEMCLRKRGISSTAWKQPFLPLQIPPLVPFGPEMECAGSLDVAMQVHWLPLSDHVLDPKTSPLPRHPSRSNRYGCGPHNRPVRWCRPTVPVSEYTTAASAMAFDEEKRQNCTMEAWRAGLVGGFQALAVSGPITYLADRKWAAFRNRLGVSGKVATAISPFFAMFYLRSEQVILECARRGRTIESYRGE